MDVERPDTALQARELGRHKKPYHMIFRHGRACPGNRAKRGRETLETLLVVDADVHVHEDPAELAEYAEPPWDVALREIAKVDERYLDLPGDVAAGGVPHPVPRRLEPAADRHDRR